MNWKNKCADCDYWVFGICKMPEIVYNEAKCNQKTSADDLCEMFYREKRDAMDLQNEKCKNGCVFYINDECQFLRCLIGRKPEQKETPEKDGDCQFFQKGVYQGKTHKAIAPGQMMLIMMIQKEKKLQDLNDLFAPDFDVNALLTGKKKISWTIASKLESFLGLSSNYWMNHQTAFACDLYYSMIENNALPY